MKKINNILLSILIFIELLIYIYFVNGDITESYETKYIKYISIILIVLYTIIYSLINKKINLFFSLGLLFTLFADTFLLLLDNYYEVGLICFNLVQTYYFIGLKNQIKKIFIPQAFLRIVIFISCLIIGITIDDLVSLLSLSYISFLIFNILSLLFFSEKKKEEIFLLIGLILFLLCDISVGINNIAYSLDISYKNKQIIDSITDVTMWLFYLPSQIIICIYTNLSHKIK